MDARENRAPATENPALSPDDTISAFGETDAKRAAVAAERYRMEEGGDLAAQAVHEARESLITDEERRRRARAAGIHNAVNDQAKDDQRR